MVNIPGMTHPVELFFLEDLPQLMGRHSIPASRLGLARFGMLDEEDVDCELVACVVAWVAQYYAQGDGAILCFLPVILHGANSASTPPGEVIIWFLIFDILKDHGSYVLKGMSTDPYPASVPCNLYDRVGIQLQWCARDFRKCRGAGL